MEVAEKINYLDKLLNSCRVCEKADPYANLFYNISRELLRNLVSVLQSDITEQDGLSRWLCRECTEKVEEFTKFRQQYEETSSKILFLIQESPTKVENISEEYEGEVEVNEILENYEVEAIDESLDNALSPIEITQTTEEEQKLFSEELATFDEGNESFSNCEKYFQCDSCLKVYKHSNSLIRHIKITHENLRHRCSVCSTEFTQKSSLFEHMRCVHKDIAKAETFYCEACGNKPFNSRKTLKSHMKTHSTEDTKRISGSFSMKSKIVKLYRRQCPICGNFYKNIEEHKLTHQAENSYKCTFPDCTKSFKFVSSLNVHLRVHNGERKFQCKICDKKFRVSHHLKAHLSTHSALKEFVCDFEDCSKKFSSKLNLYKHSKVHFRAPETVVGVFSDT